MEHRRVIDWVLCGEDILALLLVPPATQCSLEVHEEFERVVKIAVTF